MYMTDGEIITSYKQAKNPQSQIHVLAELNGTDTATMRAKLRSLGFDVKEPKARPKRAPSVLPLIESETLRRMFLAGLSDREIAEELGVSVWNVQNRRLALGMTRNRGGSRPGTPRKRKQRETKLSAPSEPEVQEVLDGDAITVSVLAEMLEIVRQVHPQAKVQVRGAAVTGVDLSVHGPMQATLFILTAKEELS